MCPQQLAVPVHAACLEDKMVFRLKPLQRNNPPTNRICLSCYRAVHTKVRKKNLPELPIAPCKLNYLLVDLD